MKSYQPNQIRNVAVVGHGGAGKTMLTEALLLASGAINRMGKVEDGSATTDFEPEEAKRQHSVAIGLAPIEWEGHKINLIDCPGYPDYMGDVAGALRATDACLFVVSAVDGVEVQTELVWDLAEQMGLPRMIVINKLDRERASFQRTLDELTDKFGTKPFPLQMPVGEEGSFSGVVDLLQMKGFSYDQKAPSGQAVDVPAELASQVDELRGRLIEAAAEGDDEMLEKYLEGAELTEKEIAAGMSIAVAAGTTAPVLVTSATHLIGVDLLAHAIVELVPPPTARPPITGTAGGTEVSRQPTPDEPLCAFVFKTVSDPFVGKISIFRVLSGHLRPDHHVWNTTQNRDERVAQVFALRGKHHDNVSEVVAGDIGAVAKLAHTHTGDTLCEESAKIVLPPIEFPAPVLSIAIEPKAKGEEDKLVQALARLHEEDPIIMGVRDAETHQTVLSGLGEAHLDVTMERMARKFHVEVNTLPMRIPYRETIKSKAQYLSKYVKQSGGRGQYAVAHLWVEPLPKGGGYEFNNKIVGGAIPGNFIPSVDKGVQGAMKEGALAGYPVIDVAVTLDDGKVHSVDSSDMAFQMAGSMGFKEACRLAGVTLLEPVMDVFIRVPDAMMGDIMGDVNAKRGKILGTEQDVRGYTAIHAAIPQAEMLRYAIDLRSMTGGRGAFRTEPSHYEEVPQHLQQKIVDAHKAELEAAGKH